MKHLALIIALAAFSTSAFAEGSYQDVDELRLVRAVSVTIRDQVKDGCLSSPNALKVEAELILRRSGISITDRKSLSDYQLGVVPFGAELKPPRGTCAVVLRVHLWRFARAPEGHSALIIAYENGTLLSGYTKSEMQENLRASVSKFVSDLANEILKAQGK